MEQEVRIVVYLTEEKLKTATNFKYLIVDTIEDRGIGEVINEGIFLEEKKVEIDFITSTVDKIDEIKSILFSLGINEKEYLITFL